MERLAKFPKQESTIFFFLNGSIQSPEVQSPEIVGVNIVISNQFRILGLLETWITLDEVYGAILCWALFLWFLNNQPSTSAVSGNSATMYATPEMWGDNDCTFIFVWTVPLSFGTKYWSCIGIGDTGLGFYLVLVWRGNLHYRTPLVPSK